MSNSHIMRKARTRTLIQLGGLIEKAGLFDSFDTHLCQVMYVMKQGNLVRGEEISAPFGQGRT